MKFFFFFLKKLYNFELIVRNCLKLIREELKMDQNQLEEHLAANEVNYQQVNRDCRDGHRFSSLKVPGTLSE